MKCFWFYIPTWHQVVEIIWLKLKLSKVTRFFFISFLLRYFLWKTSSRVFASQWSYEKKFSKSLSEKGYKVYIKVIRKYINDLGIIQYFFFYKLPTWVFVYGHMQLYWLITLWFSMSLDLLTKRDFTEVTLVTYDK